jgi:hypothetical protein
MDRQLKGYVQAYGYEGWGDHNFGTFIDVSVGRPLTREDGYVIEKHADEIRNELLAITIKQDPVKMQEAADERAAILGLFPNPIFVEDLPNGYCSRGCCRHRPWFLVTTPIGRIKIGWRKRVISITWDDTDRPYADQLFPNEDVTKFNKTIHAWGLEKAKEYLKVLLG